MWKKAIVLSLAASAAGCADSPRLNVWPPSREAAQKEAASLKSELAAARERGASLEARVEALSANIRSLQKENGDLQAALERLEREKVMQGNFSSPPRPRETRSARRPPVPRSRRSASATPRRLYNEAYRAVRDGQNEEAIIGFRRFLELLTNNQLAPNSQYWLAEAYYDLREYAAALDEFQHVISRYPRSRKAPDAHYKLALTHLRRDSPPDARREFERLIKKFPRHSLARRARAQLRKLDAR